MHQTWEKLLFLHWSVPSEVLRPHLPEGLRVDTFQDRAWIGITPFTMRDVRPPLLPAIPRVSETHELNVRTYVHWNGVPGVWFFSLDASNPLAVAGARLAYHLPYYQARMKRAGAVEKSAFGRDETLHFSSTRSHPGAPAAHFEASWKGGPALPLLEPDTLDFFLIERYLLFSARKGQLYQARIHHSPWELREADLKAFSSSMFTAQGLPEPKLPPLVHAQREPLSVEIWPLKKV